MTTEELRNILMDYYGTAATTGNRQAIINLVQVENASEDELIWLAQEAGIKVDQ